jgi:hypothetical protein
LFLFRSKSWKKKELLEKYWLLIFEKLQVNANNIKRVDNIFICQEQEDVPTVKFDIGCCIIYCNEWILLLQIILNDHKLKQSLFNPKNSIISPLT